MTGSVAQRFANAMSLKPGLEPAPLHHSQPGRETGATDSNTDLFRGKPSSASTGSSP